ncbi:hypothetical protein AB0G15_25950 [Streptosporangium sp. NPDC023825]|uniref:hypothetical protein n=1 Tax=Streptosporangium sp. NPDC023825 TaxID=3154909 RepID=UPI003422E205
MDFPPGRAIRHPAGRALRAAFRERDTVFGANDVLAAAEPVRHDPGARGMPEPIAARFPDLITHRFARHGPSWKIMVARPRRAPSPAAAALLRHII